MSEEYTLTIKIANGGTKHINDEGVESNSLAGHMWYSLSDGNETNSYGFASGEDKAKPFGKGERVINDDKAYQDTYYTVQVQLTKEEYDKLKEFGGHPEKNGFTKNYNVLTNSCIDFTWKALEHAGMNDKQYEGKILPTSNAYKVDERMYEYMFGSKEGWKETWDTIHKESKHIVYGNENSNTLTGSDKNEVFYTGKGDDIVSGGQGDDTYIYKKGDGNLTIQDNGFDKNDKLIMQGFNSEDAVFTLSEDKKDLSITFSNEEGNITIKDYQNGGEIENLTFDDKELNAKDIEDKLQEQQEKQAYDNIKDYQEEDKIENLALDDKLQNTEQISQTDNLQAQQINQAYRGMTVREILGYENSQSEKFERKQDSNDDLQTNQSGNARDSRMTVSEILGYESTQNMDAEHEKLEKEQELSQETSVRRHTR